MMTETLSKTVPLDQKTHPIFMMKNFSPSVPPYTSFALCCHMSSQIMAAVLLLIVAIFYTRWLKVCRDYKNF